MNGIKVEIRSAFGVEKIYPACETAEGFCKRIGQTTLTEQNIKHI